MNKELLGRRRWFSKRYETIASKKTTHLSCELLCLFYVHPDLRYRFHIRVDPVLSNLYLVNAVNHKGNSDLRIFHHQLAKQFLCTTVSKLIHMFSR